MILMSAKEYKYFAIITINSDIIICLEYYTLS